MDRRSWPWKKKSSDKAAAEKAAAAADSFATEAEQVSSVMISFSASLSIDQEYRCLSNILHIRNIDPESGHFSWVFVTQQLLP